MVVIRNHTIAMKRTIAMEKTTNTLIDNDKLVWIYSNLVISTIILLCNNIVTFNGVNSHLFIVMIDIKICSKDTICYLRLH